MAVLVPTYINASNSPFEQRRNMHIHDGCNRKIIICFGKVNFKTLDNGTKDTLNTMAEHISIFQVTKG
jgi:hypothetical protein